MTDSASPSAYARLSACDLDRLRTYRSQRYPDLVDQEVCYPETQNVVCTVDFGAALPSLRKLVSTLGAVSCKQPRFAAVTLRFYDAARPPSVQVFQSGNCVFMGSGSIDCTLYYVQQLRFVFEHMGLDVRLGDLTLRNRVCSGQVRHGIDTANFEQSDSIGSVKHTSTFPGILFLTRPPPERTTLGGGSAGGEGDDDDAGTPFYHPMDVYDRLLDVITGDDGSVMFLIFESGNFIVMGLQDKDDRCAQRAFRCIVPVLHANASRGTVTSRETSRRTRHVALAIKQNFPLLEAEATSPEMFQQSLEGLVRTAVEAQQQSDVRAAVKAVLSRRKRACRR